MKHYIIKQFLRNRAYMLSLVLLFLAGIMAISTGKRFLDRQQDIVARSAQYQQESIEQNLKFHKDDLGLIFYYLKLNLVNETPRLAGLNIGLRDINPNIQGVTIRNLEEQRHNTDFYNPANTASGNFDFVFVVIFIFPLILIAMLYNTRSEEVELGTWKMLAIQTENTRKYLDLKLITRVSSVLAVYCILFVIALLWLKIPVDTNTCLFFVCGLLYLLFWASVSRWAVSLGKSSAYNALLLVGIWIIMNFVVPMTANIIIEKAVPVNNSIEAFMKQRDGYHNKWDEPRTPTMQRFYKIYPQFGHYTVTEEEPFTWTWYYAMQHLGDAEAQPAAKKYAEEIMRRNAAAEALGWALPNIQTMLATGNLAGSGVLNQQAYGNALEKFHEKNRLGIYDAIFSKKAPSEVNWSRYRVAYFREVGNVSVFRTLAPYIILIALFFALSQLNFKKND